MAVEKQPDSSYWSTTALTMLAARTAAMSSWCNRLAEYSLLGLGILMTLIVVSQVFCRYVLNDSLFWSEELARFLLVWLTFLGASVAYWRGMHPGVDVLYARLPSPAKRINRIIVHLLSLFFFAIMIGYGVKFAYFIRLQTTPALGLAKWIIFAIIPASGILFTLHGVAMLFHELCPQKNTRKVTKR